VEATVGPFLWLKSVDMKMWKAADRFSFGMVALEGFLGEVGLSLCSFNE